MPVLNICCYRQKITDKSLLVSTAKYWANATRTFQALYLDRKMQQRAKVITSLEVGRHISNFPVCYASW